jgi:phosphatidylinositol alpha-1,6-mannosyltransferase
LKDVSLDIVGDGPGLYCGRKLARDLRVADSVAFHGYVPYGELPRYYRTSALTLSPMQIYDIDGWFDGSIQESLACGTPVAAFKISSEAPLQGTYGFLLSRNEEKAAEELQKLLKNQDETDEVAKEGSRFVRENCSCDKVALKLEKTLESVACI